MKRAINQLKLKPRNIIIDGLYCPEINDMKMQAIVKGDSKYDEISAASIIAKVERDKFMLELDKKFPKYQFKKHKGYPTKEHLRLIMEHGVCEEHRKTFKPISTLI